MGGRDGGIENSVLNRLTFRYLYYIQVEIFD